MKKIVSHMVLVWIGIILCVVPSRMQAKEIGWPQTETITMTAVGDIMMHKEQIEAGSVPGTESYQFDYMFEQIKPYIEKADIAIGNLETTLAGKDKGYTGYPQFNAPEELAAALKNTGFDVITTANNHSLDRRYAGVIHTLEMLEDVGLAHTGTARTKDESEQVLIQDVKGIKIAFMAYTYGTNGISPDKGKGYSVNYLSKEKIKRDIALAKKQGADLICVSMHFGEEYQRQPHASQKAWVDFLFENGVNIVLGSHPHVLQPMEKRGDNRFVVYSLGNFVSAQTTRYRDSSIVLNFTISKNFETGETTIDTVDYMPIWTDLSRVGGKPHFRILPVEYALADYEQKRDQYLSYKDYEELKISLADTSSMYSREKMIQTPIQIDGQWGNYEAVQIEGRTFVELRKLSNALGSQVIWDGERNQSTLIGENNTFTLMPGSKYVFNGEEATAWEAAPRMIKGKIFVPIRGFAEGMGKCVAYDSSEKHIVIN